MIWFACKVLLLALLVSLILGLYKFLIAQRRKLSLEKQGVVFMPNYPVVTDAYRLLK